MTESTGAWLNWLEIFFNCVFLYVRAPQLLLTHEQQQILSHSIQTDHVVKIMAFAGTSAVIENISRIQEHNNGDTGFKTIPYPNSITGTGKTTTLVKYAEQRPDLRFLYVSFNKSVASEAQRSFPKNVSCKTIHSLAFQDVGKRWEAFEVWLTYSDMEYFCKFSWIKKKTNNTMKYSVKCNQICLYILIFSMEDYGKTIGFSLIFVKLVARYRMWIQVKQMIPDFYYYCKIKVSSERMTCRVKFSRW